MTSKIHRLLIYQFTISDSCAYGKNERFFVKFHNSAKFAIDIKMYGNTYDMISVKSAVAPGVEYAHEALFKDKFFFTKSDTNDRLNASANGIKSTVFEGCLFKAEQGRMITVYISEGITQ